VGKPRCGHALIYNGLSDGEFQPVTPDPNVADFLFIGEMRALKGPDIFIAALARASAARGNAMTAVMVVDGKDRAQLIEQVQAAELSGNIRFLVPMKAREAFRLAKVAVIPSRAEALPYIVLEALAAGRPVIASRIGGIPEILGDSYPALVQPDVDDLAAKMASVIQDMAGFQQLLPDTFTLKQRFSGCAPPGRIFCCTRQLTSPLFLLFPASFS
jgi:glycosyltransferase involved in cell wall biosynthesis